MAYLDPCVGVCGKPCVRYPPNQHPNAGTAWTAEHDGIIMALLGTGKRPHDMEEFTGRTYDEIAERLLLLIDQDRRSCFPNAVDWTKAEDEKLLGTLNYGGGIAQAAKLLSRSEGEVKRRKDWLGIQPLAKAAVARRNRQQQFESEYMMTPVSTNSSLSDLAQRMHEEAQAKMRHKEAMYMAGYGTVTDPQYGLVPDPASLHMKDCFCHRPEEAEAIASNRRRRLPPRHDLEWDKSDDAFLEKYIDGGFEADERMDGKYNYRDIAKALGRTTHDEAVIDDIVLTLTTSDSKFYKAAEAAAKAYAGDYERTGNWGQDDGGWGYYHAMSEALGRMCWCDSQGKPYWNYGGDKVRIKSDWYNTLCMEIAEYYKDKVVRDHTEDCVDKVVFSGVVREREWARPTVRYLVERWSPRGCSYAFRLCAQQGLRMPLAAIKAWMTECWHGNLRMALDFPGSKGSWHESDIRIVVTYAEIMRDAYEYKYLGKLMDGCPEAASVEFSRNASPSIVLWDDTKESETTMADLTYNLKKVIETGTQNLELHKTALAKAQADAETQINAYAAKVAGDLVRGEEVKAKQPQIDVIADQTKTYEKHLRQLSHLAGDTVASTPAVEFLLRDAEDVNRPVKTAVALVTE